jgi:hypothetical protein
MSSFFLLNNFHFGIELVGALVFLMVAWLLFDTYFIRKEISSLLRSSGFIALFLWQIFHSFNISNDLIGYLSFIFYLVGLALIIISFLKEAKPLSVNAIIILPAFTAFVIPFNSLVFIGLIIISFLSYRRYKIEFNKALIPFWAGFLSLSLGALISIFYNNNSTDFIWLVGHIFEIAGFLSLGWWVWQYIELRIKESMILIFVMTTFFMAIVVTLAFSTIFVSNMESSTETNLLINAKVLDFSISHLKGESLAKARFIAGQSDVIKALTQNNFSDLEQHLASYLEEENLGFLMVVDPNGNVLLRAHALSQKEDNVSGESAVDEALKGKSSVTIETSPGEKFSIRAGAPIFIQGKIKGAIIAGFPFDNAMVDGIKKITGLDMSVFEKDVQIATTILNPDGRTRSVGISEASTEVKDKVLAKGEDLALRVEILSRPFLAGYLPLYNADGKIVGMISAAKPQQEILDVVNSTNQMTFVTVIILMLFLITPIYFVTKRLLNEII